MNGNAKQRPKRLQQVRRSLARSRHSIKPTSRAKRMSIPEQPGQVGFAERTHTFMLSLPWYPVNARSRRCQELTFNTHTPAGTEVSRVLVVPFLRRSTAADVVRLY